MQHLRNAEKWHFWTKKEPKTTNYGNYPLKSIRKRGAAKKKQRRKVTSETSSQ